LSHTNYTQLDAETLSIYVYTFGTNEHTEYIIKILYTTCHAQIYHLCYPHSQKIVSSISDKKELAAGMIYLHTQHKSIKDM